MKIIQAQNRELGINTLNKYDRSILILAFLISTLTLLQLGFYHFKLIVNPYQIEYREGIILMTTDLLTKGGNPYALSNQPQYTNVYGIFYHWLAYPLSYILGSSLIIHRAISAFFILASSLVLFLTLRRLKVAILFSFMAAIIYYGHLLFLVTPAARPDALGCFLFLCSVIIPWKYNFSRASLVLGLGIGILGFLTKPYFFLGIPYLCMYLFLFKSKKEGILLGFISLISTIFVLFIINFYYETYISNTIFNHINIADMASDSSHTIKQVHEFFQYNFGLVLALLMSGFLLIFRKKNAILGSVKFNRLIKNIKNSFSLAKFEEPLILHDFNFILFCFILSCLIFWFSLGKHAGNWMVYIYHLISPFFIILIFNSIKKQSKIINLILIVLVVINLVKVSSYYPAGKANYSLKEWHKVEQMIAHHDNVLNSPAIVSILLKYNKPIYDGGSSEYFQYGANRPFFLKPDTQVEVRNQNFSEEIKNFIINRKFDLAIISKKAPFVPRDMLEKYYQYQDSIILPMYLSNREWKLEIWRPIVSSEK